MSKNRRANSVVFGFDFQVNAAIVLFLENIEDVEKICLEGNYEDIELELSSGKMILAQAKSVVKASSDFRNVRKNLKKALISLAEAGEKIDTKELIMITNSLNPFNDNKSRNIFYGPTHRDYDTLPPSAKNIIDGYLSKMDKFLDINKLKIQVLPFETDNEKERYKVVKECIDNFIGNLNINIPGIGNKILDTWHWQVFDNGGKEDADIKLTKRDIIWPLLVKITEIEQCDDSFLEQFDLGMYEEVANKYSELIDSHCERCEFFIKILSDYNNFKTEKNLNEKLNDFIEEYWNEYISEFAVDGVEKEVQEALAKIIIHNIIKKRFTITKIKKGVKLC